MRRGGGGGGGGRGGGVVGGGGRRGNGRRDAGPGGVRDDRGRHGDRRPDSRRRRSPSPDRDHGGRRLRDRDDDRDRDFPRRGREGYGRAPPYRGNHDRPGRGDGDRDRDLPRGLRGDYERSPPYRDYHDRAGSGDRRSYEAPPDYMLPDHPSDLGQPSLRPARKESEFFRGLGRRSANRDSEFFGAPSGRNANRDTEFFGAPGGRSANKDSEFFGEVGATLRVCSTGMERTSSLYLDGRSPPPLPPRVSPPSSVLYPIVAPTETGFLTGGSTMKARENFGAASSGLLHDGNEFQYRDHLHEPLGERSREREFDRLYPGRDVHHDRDGEMNRLYSSKGVLGAELVPSTELKSYGGSSSSLLAKDRPYRLHGESGYVPSNGHAMDELGRPSHDSLGYVSSQAPRFSESSLEHGNGHDGDITRQKHPKHSPRDPPMEHDVHEYRRRDPLNDAYLVPENLRENAPQVSRATVRHMLGSSSLTGLRKDERIDHQVRLTHRMPENEDTMHDRMELNVQHSYHGDALTHHRRKKEFDVRYSHSPEIEHLGLARRPVRQREFASFDGHEFSDQEVSPVCRGRIQRSTYRDDVMEPYQADDSPLGQEYYDDDMDPYIQSPGRMTGSYDVDDQDKYDARYDFPTNRNVFSRIILTNDINEEWLDTDQGDYPHLSPTAYGHSKYKPMSQRLSRPNDQSLFGGFSMHGKGRGGWTKSAKKRLRSAHPRFHVGYTSGRDGFVGPNKRLKLIEDNHNNPKLHHEDAPEDEDRSMQKDPPEGSEEFNKQVHQAFLKYTKLLNESSAAQKRFREAPKGSLSCCVCDSFTRKFPDIDALISHAYDTCKVGLKTKHLGFHKALCVLMGWNWSVAPDTSKAYHSMPDDEVNAMKGDLMLWPPVVIIHNSSIASKTKVTETKIVSIEEVEGALADIGVACDKAKISFGKPANQSVFLVKFLPTISGFQEAMRIHEHFTTINHGKEEFQQIKGGKGKKAAPADELEELLYAHIAVAEDLGYLDEEAKKRCVVTSKNDIEAKADATLNLDS